MESSGRKIGQLVNKNGSKEQTDESLVYKIPCHGCSLPYFGETSRGLKKRISEHKRDLKYHNINNALVKHTQSCQRLPDWEKADILKANLNRTGRKLLESALIEALPCTNSKAGDIRVARGVATMILEEQLSDNVT